MKNKILALIVLASLGVLSARPARANIVQNYPNLKKYLFEEESSAFYLGFGISPLSVLNNRVYFTANIFQLQWLNRTWDLELLSASFGFTVGREDYSNSRHFTFRSSPKWRINELISIGPLLGFEFVSFPSLQARFFKDGLFSPSEPFSSRGIIYGLSLSETFRFGDDYFLKLNQNIYQQTYSTTETSDGWTYLYDRADIQADRSPIKSSLVFMLEVSFLY